MKTAQNNHSQRKQNQNARYAAKQRLISLLLAVILLLTSLTACFSSHKPDGSHSLKDIPRDTGTTADTDTQAYEIVYPEVSVSEMEYTLSDADLDQFRDKLKLCEMLLRSDDKKNSAKLRKALYELGSSEAYIGTQFEIAYLLYIYDLSDSVAEKHLQHASTIYAEAESLLWSFFTEAEVESTALSSIVLNFMHDNYSAVEVLDTDEIDRASARMTEIENELLGYNGLATYEEAHPLYTEYIYEAQSYAEAHGYANFYDCATYVHYSRDYGKEERDFLRQYVKEYLVPLYKAHCAKADALMNDLTLLQELQTVAYVEDGYHTLSGDPLFSYIESLPSGPKEVMLEIFEKDHILIGDREDSLFAAFTYAVGNTTICYFHKELTDLESVSHEIGHYYHAVLHGGKTWITQDLAEVHSQANSLLMLRYLSETLDHKSFKAAMAYIIAYVMLDSAIYSTVADEFEEIVFSSPDSHAYSVDELNEIMQGLIDEYDITGLSSSLAPALMNHWNSVDVTDVGYHISYTTSLLVALQIYIKSLDDYEAATICYQKFVENSTKDTTFLETVANSGLLSPFEEDFYIELADKDLF